MKRKTQFKIWEIFLDWKKEDKEEENCYKPVTVRNLWSNNYIEYKSNGDRNKKLSAAKYLNKIRPYLKDIKNNLKNLTRGKFN